MPNNLMQIFIFFCDFIMVASCALLLIFFLQRVSLPELFVIFLIFASAIIIFSAYLLSLAKAIGIDGFLTIHALLLGLVFVIARFKRRRGMGVYVVSDKKRLSEDIKGQRIILSLGVGVIIFVLTSIFLGFFVSPNNWDSMTYHLSRVGFWNQNQHLGPYVTANVRQVFLYPNAEILLLWPVVFLSRDILAFLPQLTAYAGIIILIYMTARFLGFNHRWSLFSAFIWASLTEVLLEATSTQNDLVLTFFLMGSLFFFLKGLREKLKSSLVISAVSLGLALGTKGTALFLLPAFFVGGLMYGFKNHSGRFKLFIFWLCSAFVAFLLLGSYIYVQNLINYGVPLGPMAVVKAASTFSFFNMVKNLAYIGWRFFDTSGLLFLKIPGFYPRAAFHEDLAGYGLTWLVVCLPSFGYCLYRWNRQRDPDRGTLIFAAIIFLSLFAASLDKNAWLFRLLIPLTVLMAPFAGHFYSFCQGKTRFKIAKDILCLLVFLAAMTQILTVAICNPSKPFYIIPSLQKTKMFEDHKSVLQMDRYEKRYLLFSGLKLKEMDIYKGVDLNIAGNANLGFLGSGDDWDYPAFGEQFQRKVFHIIFSSVAQTRKEIAEKKLDYLLVFGPDQKFEDHDRNVLPLVDALLNESEQAPLLKKSGDFYLFDVRNVR